jgi:hypothetical protein
VVGLRLVPSVTRATGRRPEDSESGAHDKKFLDSSTYMTACAKARFPLGVSGAQVLKIQWRSRDTSPPAATLQYFGGIARHFWWVVREDNGVGRTGEREPLELKITILHYRLGTDAL